MKNKINIYDPIRGIADTRKREPTQNIRLVINHEGRFKIIWDWIVLVLVMFTAIHIPYHAAFKKFQGTILDDISRSITLIHPIALLSLFVDCMFILDIFINFRTTYVQPSSDEVVKKPKMIAIHYLKTWFVIDLLAAIPFDWILYRSDDGSNNTSTLIGLLKSARLLRLFRVARRIDRYSEYGLAVLFLLLCLFTLFAHWVACVWNFIARYEENNFSSWVRLMDIELNGPYVVRRIINGTNVTNLNVENNYPIRMTSSQRYIASLYFVMSSLTSVGFGNVAATTEAEQLFSVIIMLLGALMYATIFGNMVAIVQRLYSKASSFHEQVNTIREFLKCYKIPEDLRTSIIYYVRREWNTSNGVDLQKVLRAFPDTIQADLTYEIYRSIFYNVKPLRDATISCMRVLSTKFKTMNLHVNQHAIRQGEVLNRLYIIGKGSLEISADGELKVILAKNAIFGYDFVRNPKNSKSNSNVRASSFVEIHYIDKDDMRIILNMYPKFAKKFCANLKLDYDLNDENEEGNWQADGLGDKFHIVSIARKVLDMPLVPRKARYLASLYKISNKPCKNKCKNSNIKSSCSTTSKNNTWNKTQSLPSLNGTIETYSAASKSVDQLCRQRINVNENPANQEKNLDQHSNHRLVVDQISKQRKKVDQLSKQGSNTPIINHILPESTYKSNNNQSNERKTVQVEKTREKVYLEFSGRLDKIENTVSNMRAEIDGKLSVILKLLNDVIIKDGSACNEQT